MPESKEMLPAEVPVEAMGAIDIPMLNIQVATAKKWPRGDIVAIEAKIHDIIARDQELAAQCYYYKPAGKTDGVMKYASGPSVRLSELMFSQWQNIMIQVQTTEDDKGCIGQARAFDAEKNTAVQITVRRMYTSTRPQSRQNTYNSASSIAFRNGVLRVIPRAIAENLWKFAEKVAGGEEKDVPEKIERLFTAFAEFKVTKEMILKYLGLKDERNITRAHYVTMIGVFNGIKGGDTDIAEVFNSKRGSAFPGLDKLASREGAGGAGDVPPAPSTPAPPRTLTPEEKKGAQQMDDAGLDEDALRESF